LLQKPHSVSYQQRASTGSLALAIGYCSLKLRQTNTTGDSCDGEISVLNHCLSWSKFVNTHWYHHSRQWFKLHVCATVYPGYYSRVFTALQRRRW